MNSNFQGDHTNNLLKTMRKVIKIFTKTTKVLRTVDSGSYIKECFGWYLTPETLRKRPKSTELCRSLTKLPEVGRIVLFSCKTCETACEVISLVAYISRVVLKRKFTILEQDKHLRMVCQFDDVYDEPLWLHNVKAIEIGPWLLVGYHLFSYCMQLNVV